MSLVIAFLIVVAAAAVGIAAMLLVRRTAPDGSYFHDGDRAAGVFGVLATGFAVLLGFVVFLAFTSYDAARAGAEAEALTVAQQVETAQFFATVGRRRADWRAGVLRPVGGRGAVGADGVRDARGTDQSLGGGAVPDAADGRTADADRAVRLRQVARPDVGSRGGAHRSDPRGGRRDPDAAVAGAVLQRRPDLRVHVVLRRQRGAGRRPGAAHRHGRGRDRGDAACCSTSSTTRSTTASVVFARWQWSERWRSSIRSWRSSATKRRSHATPAETRSSQARRTWTG